VERIQADLVVCLEEIAHLIVCLAFLEAMATGGVKLQLALKVSTGICIIPTLWVEWIGISEMDFPSAA
jgi:hypothetical protein